MDEIQSTGPGDKLETEAREMLQRYLRAGFHSIDEAKATVTEILSDDSDPELVRSIVERVAPDCARAHEQESSAWPSFTDCDRLDAAFEELNAIGIMARHNWTCCGTCGRAEMPDEFNRIDGMWDGVPVIGYVFYHQQDSENAAEGSSLYINYGSCEEAPDEATYSQMSVSIAQTACEVIKKHGLDVDWDGSISTRPRIEITWQRRRPPARFVGD
jgi:hypothetical protein